MSSRALPISLVAVLALVASARVIAVWDELPPTMASHFGPSGQPDGFQSKAAFFGLFVLIGLGTVLLLLATPALLRFVPPQLINIPHREYWLVPSRIDEARGMLARYMDWFSAAITLFLVLTLELVLRANLRRGPLEDGVLIGALVVFFGFTIAWLIAMWRGFRPRR